MTDIRRSYDENFLDVTPHNSTITRYLTKVDLTPVLKYLVALSAKPLAAVESQFAIDSTGFRPRPMPAGSTTSGARK